MNRLTVVNEYLNNNGHYFIKGAGICECCLDGHWYLSLVFVPSLSEVGFELFNASTNKTL